MVLQILIINEKVKKSAYVTGEHFERLLSCVIFKISNIVNKIVTKIKINKRSVKWEIFLKRMNLSIPKFIDFFSSTEVTTLNPIHIS